MIKRLAIWLTIAATAALVAVPAAAAPAESGLIAATGPIPQADVPGHWAAAPIDRMLGKTVAFGFADLTFRPDKPMSRLDVAIMLVRLLGLAPLIQTRAEPAFVDVAALSDQQKGYLDVAARYGLMVGDGPAMTFRPFESIRRQEVAVILMRALGAEGELNPIDQAPFADAAAIPAWAHPYIAAAAREGLVVGYPDGTFGPGRDVTRAEATTMLARSDDRISSAVDMLEVRGRVVAQAPGSVTIRTADGAEQKLALGAGARIYGEVREGAAAVAVLTGIGTVALLDAAGPFASGLTYHRITGTVTAVGPESLNLRLPDGQTVTLSTPAGTAYYAGARRTGRQELQVGQAVAVTALATDARAATEVRMAGG